MNVYLPLLLITNIVARGLVGTPIKSVVLDPEGTGNDQRFRSGHFSKDYLVGISPVGKITFKLKSASGSVGTTFQLKHINPGFYASCWSDNNICVFAGSKRLEAYDLGITNTPLLKDFRHDKIQSNNNRYQVVQILPLSKYFVALDYANLGITRWNIDDNTEYVFYLIGGNITGEGEDIEVITSTGLMLCIFDNTKDLFLLDYTTMTEIRKFHNTNKNLTDGGRAVYVERFPNLFLMSVAQKNPTPANAADTTYINHFDYNTGALHGYHRTTATIISGANAPDTSFILWATSSSLLLQRVNFPNIFTLNDNPMFNGDVAADTFPERVVWYPDTKKFLVIMERGLIEWSIGSDDLGCGLECKYVDGASFCTQNFVKQTCTDCSTVGDTVPCTFTNADFADSSKVINLNNVVYSGASTKVTFPEDVIVVKSEQGLLTANLPFTNDIDNETTSIIAYVILGIISIVSVFFCCGACIFRRQSAVSEQEKLKNIEICKKEIGENEFFNIDGQELKTEVNSNKKIPGASISQTKKITIVKKQSNSNKEQHIDLNCLDDK